MAPNALKHDDMFLPETLEFEKSKQPVVRIPWRTAHYHTYVRENNPFFHFFYITLFLFSGTADAFPLRP